MMLKITGRDYLTIAGVAALLIVLFIVGTRDNANPIPADDRHRSFIEALQKGRDRIDAEKGCITCHNLQSLLLSKKHPPKEQCLICHKPRK